MKKVFVIGNASSIWVKEYIRNIHLKLGNKVYLTDYTGLSGAERDFYINNGVELVPLTCKTNLEKVFEYTKVFNNFAKKHGSEIDLIDIQGPAHSFQAKIWARFIKKCNTRAVVTFWGSDILRLPENKSKNMKKTLDCCDLLNIGTLEMHDVLRKHFGNIYDDKCVYIGFGSPAIGEIQECTLTKTECKSYFGMNPDKISVAVGYNGRRTQQHLNVIETVKTLSNEIKDAIELLLHVGPSTEPEYIQELKNALDGAGISYQLNENMMDLETVAKLRIATDIMVHAQVTDGLSGTVRECVYAGAVLINPTWLKYDKFDQDGVDYIQYKDFDSLANIIEKIITGKLTVDTEKNRKIIYDEFSWHAVERKWEQFLNE